jgi:5-methylcytosine-specific restriction endonuclease McrA
VTKEEQIELAWALHTAAYQPRPLLTLALREQLSEQQNWRCCYCGVRMEGANDAVDAPTFEHVVPRSRGGPDELDNLVIACRQCNGLRGNGETP